MLNPTQCLENPSDSVSHLQFPIKGKKEREIENWNQKGVGNKNMIYTEWREIEKTRTEHAHEKRKRKNAKKMHGKFEICRTVGGKKKINAGREYFPMAT